jgi:hypothetical protein
VKDVTSANFGLLIAYVIPGFVMLWGFAPYSPTIRIWLSQNPTDGATIGGFLYGTIASVGAGLLISTLRWLVIDSIHDRSGIRQPAWNLRKLRDSVSAFDRIVDHQYRYYQAYANGIVSISIALPMHWIADEFSGLQLMGMLLMDALLFVGSRDVLRKYYQRVDALLSE